MVAQFYEYTKRYRIVHFKVVNAVCELYQKSGGESNTSKLYLKKGMSKGENTCKACTWIKDKLENTKNFVCR